MIYLTKEQLVLIHSLIVNETGGSHGIRDPRPILSLEHSPRQIVFGRELYPTPFLKAAVYAREIITAHPFVDGNKRTAMAAATVFLEHNGYQFTAHKGEITKFALKIIGKKLDLEAIAAWLERHAKKS